MTTAAEAALAVDRAYNCQNETTACAVKLDAGKAPVVKGFMRAFPKALEAVARVSEYGFSKYKGWSGWRKVEDGPARYLEAMQRHVLAWQAGENHDPESGLWHMQHAAWNALAVLELMIAEAGAPPAFKPYVEPPKPGAFVPINGRDGVWHRGS